MSEQRELYVWRDMKSRCNNPNHKSYHNYGGRGITICDQWSKFENFYADMGDRPTQNHSIDRRDNDGNYEPKNCRWATATEQGRNQRLKKGNKSGTAGVHQRPDGKWIASIKFEGKQIHLYHGDDFFEARSRRKSAENQYWETM